MDERRYRIDRLMENQVLNLYSQPFTPAGRRVATMNNDGNITYIHKAPCSPVLPRVLHSFEGNAKHDRYRVVQTTSGIVLEYSNCTDAMGYPQWRPIQNESDLARLLIKQVAQLAERQ